LESLFFFLVEKYLRSIHGHGHGHGHGHSPKEDKPKTKNPKSKTKNQTPTIKSSAYLNLVADIVHNFTDGLAIATSFLVNPAMGISTTIAVLFHELPHEIGDFAILIQSGLTRNQAIKAQFLTAIGALLGAVAGILLSKTMNSATTYILPFTAGGFIYIATVDVIPDLLDNSEFGQTIKEIIGMWFGIGLMVLVGLFEECS